MHLFIPVFCLCQLLHGDQEAHAIDGYSLGAKTIVLHFANLHLLCFKRIQIERTNQFQLDQTLFPEMDSDPGGLTLSVNIPTGLKMFSIPKNLSRDPHRNTHLYSTIKHFFHNTHCGLSCPRRG